MLSYDVVFKPKLLNEILLRCPGQPVGVAEVMNKPKKGRLNKRKHSIFSFWCSKGFIFLSSTIILHKIASALPVPHYLRCRSTIKRVCSLYKVNYDLIEDVNAPEFLNHLNELKPDIIVSFQHQIFKKELLKLPKICCINCHPAKLPKYRGIKPIFWAMLEGDSEIGVTVHTMKPEIDIGYIISQKTFLVLKNNTLLDNYYLAYSLSVDVIIEALSKLSIRNKFEDFPIIPKTTEYYKNPNKNDVKSFKEKGLKII